MLELKTHCRRGSVKAIRLTAANWKEVSEQFDQADGCMEAYPDDPSAMYGDWLVVSVSGNEIVPDGIFRDMYRKAKNEKAGV